MKALIPTGGRRSRHAYIFHRTIGNSLEIS